MTPPEPPRDGPLTANKAGLPTRFSQASPHLGADVLPVARPAVFSCFLSRAKSTSPENQNQLAPRPPPEKSGPSDQGCHPSSRPRSKIRSRTRLWHSPSPRLPTSTAAAGFFLDPGQLPARISSLPPCNNPFFSLHLSLPVAAIAFQPTAPRPRHIHRIDLGYPSICSCPGTWWQRRKLHLAPRVPSAHTSPSRLPTHRGQPRASSCCTTRNSSQCATR